jgi:hypothetical protein
MVTAIDNDALWPPPPLIAKVQVPAALGVTVNDEPFAGEIAATLLHEFVCPATGVVAVNEPL